MVASTEHGGQHKSHTHIHEHTYAHTLPRATSRWKGSINRIICCLIGSDEFNRSTHVTVLTSDFSPVSMENGNDGGESIGGRQSWRVHLPPLAPAPSFRHWCWEMRLLKAVNCWQCKSIFSPSKDTLYVSKIISKRFTDLCKNLYCMKPFRISTFEQITLP